MQQSEDAQNKYNHQHPEPSGGRRPFIRTEVYESELTDWNDAVPSNFENRIPKKVKRTTITVAEREMIFERSGGFFKVMGHLSELVLLSVTAALITCAIGAVFMTGKMTGTL